MGAVDYDVDAVPKELEVLTAEMETRLRTTILHIIGPCLDQMADCQLQLQTINETVDEHNNTLILVEKLREEARQLSELTYMMRESLDTRDAQTRDFEMNTSAALNSLKRNKTEVEQRFDDVQGELRRLNREAVQNRDECSRLQDQHNAAMQKTLDLVAANKTAVGETRLELLGLNREMEKRCDGLEAELYVDDMLVAKLKSDLVHLQKFCAPLPEIEMSVQRLSERTDTAEQKMQVCMKACNDMEKEFEHFVESNDKVMQDMRNEVQARINELVAHHATTIKDIRNDYSGELSAIKTVRMDITNFQTHTNTFCEELGQKLASESKRMDALHREIVKDLHEIRHVGAHDRCSIEERLNLVKKEMVHQSSLTQATKSSVEFMGRIIGLILESERVATAMHIQDFIDRRAERWLSVGGDAGKKPQPPQTPEAFDRNERKLSPVRSADPDLVVVDWRKGLAKGQYLPGLVSFGGVLYDRQDILMMHHRFVQKAHAAFQRGPLDRGPGMPIVPLVPVASQESVVGPANVSGQPGAAGGVAAGQSMSLEEHAFGESRPGTKNSASGKRCLVHESGKDEDSEDPRFFGAPHRGPSRQRPGSQGQPQAVGSRGSMSGPLGETEPPTRRKKSTTPVRLPSIAGVDAASASCDGSDLDLPSTAVSGTSTRNSTAGACGNVGSLRQKCLTAR